MCKRIAEIAPHMLKQTKLRLLTTYLDAKKLAIMRLGAPRDGKRPSE